MNSQELYANLNALLRSIRESQRAISLLRDEVDYGEESRFLLSLNEKLLMIEGTIADEVLASKMLKTVKGKVSKSAQQITVTGKKRRRPRKIQAESSIETPVAKPKGKPGRKPGPKPAINVEAKPKGKPGRKPGPKPAIKVEAKPKGKPGRKPGPKPAIIVEAKPKGKPGRKPGPKPATELAEKPAKKTKAQLTDVTPGWIIGYSILEVLSILGGQTSPWVITKSIYKVLENQLTKQDKQASFAATQRGYKGLWATHIGDSTHRERKRLTDLGFLEAKAPKGIWILSTKGKKIIENVNNLTEAYKTADIPKIKAVKVLFDFSTNIVENVKAEEEEKFAKSKKKAVVKVPAKKSDKPEQIAKPVELVSTKSAQKELENKKPAVSPDTEKTTFSSNFKSKSS